MSENTSQSEDSLIPSKNIAHIAVAVVESVFDRHDHINAKTGVFDAFGSFPGAEAVAEYILRYRRDDVPPLQFGGPLDLFPTTQLPHSITPPFTWEHPWPSAQRAGVYLIYSGGLELLYIGKASMNRNLGQRLHEYFGHDAVCLLGNHWLQPPRFVITIAMPEAMSFEAPALEEFLIEALNPTHNTHGMNRPLSTPPA